MLDPKYHGGAAIETYVDLLNAGRPAQGSPGRRRQVRARQHPAARQRPPLVDLARKSGDYTAVIEHCRSKEDLLGFAAVPGAVENVERNSFRSRLTVGVLERNEFRSTSMETE